MADDRLTSYADIPALEAEQTKIIKLVDDTITHIQSKQKELGNIQISLLDANSAKQSSEAINKGKKSIDELSVSIKQLEKLQNELVTTEAKLAVAETDTAKALAAKKLELQATNKATKDSINGVEPLSKAYIELQKQAKNAAEAFKELAITKGLDNKETKEAQKKANDLNNQLKATDAAIGNHQRNVGNYKEAISALPAPMQNVANGAKGIGDSFKALLANPIVLLITAIAAALYGLFKAFTSTDAGATLFSARMEQVSAIIDVVRQRAASLASGIGKIFSGDWSGAATDMQTAFKGISEQTKQATDAAWDYIYALDALEDAEIGYISARATNANKIAKLEFLAADRTKSVAERKAALKEAISIGEEEVKKETEFANQRYNIELEKAAKLNNINKETLKAFIEADDTKQETLLNNDKQLQRVRNNINDEGQKKLEELFAAQVNAQTKFFQENKRNNSKLTGFEEEQRKEREENAKKALEQDAKRKEQQKKRSEELAKKVTEELTNIALAEEKTTSKSLENLLLSFEQRAISLEQFNEEKERITKKSEENILNSQIEYLRKSLALSGLQKTEIDKIEKEITKITKDQNDKRYKDREQKAIETAENLKDLAEKLASEEAAIIKKANEQAKQELEKALNFEKNARMQMNQAIIEAAWEVVDMVAEAFKASYERKQEDLLKENENIDANTEKQVKAIEASTLAEEEKLRRISEAEAVAQAEKEKNELKIADLKTRSARLDKMIEIAKIGGQTISDIAALKGQLALATAEAVRLGALVFANPLLAPAASAMAASVGIIGATIGVTAGLGAAQIAAVAARPIPKYAEGTGSHKGGLAILGDGKEHELVIEPNKKPYWSANTDTLYNLPKHTQVIPESKLGSAVTQPSNKDVVNAVMEMSGLIDGGLNKLNRTIRNKETVRLEAKNRRWQDYYYENAKA